MPNPTFPYGEREIAHLSRKDKKLGELIARTGMIAREVHPNLFESLVSSIVSQQISSRAAETVWNRLGGLLGEITPENILAAADDEIQKCGLSHRKVSYICGIAQMAADGGIDFDKLPSLPDDEVIRQLVKLRGVGVWTAEMLLIFTLGRPDIVSYDDLAIRRGMMTLYGLKELGREQFEKYRKRYSPYGTTASLYLWQISHEQA